jgi:hypothetical protein
MDGDETAWMSTLIELVAVACAVLFALIRVA